MILLLTTTIDPHADVLVDRLRRRQAECVRLNWDDFPQRLGLQIDFDDQGWHAALRLPLGRIFDCTAVTAAWCRRVPSAVANPTIVPMAARRLAAQESTNVLQGLVALLGDRYWMNHPQRMTIAEAKLSQLETARRLGFQIPRTRITNDPKAFRTFHTTLGGSVITKLVGIVRDLTEDGVLIYTSELDESVLEESATVALCPTLIQEKVPKAIELRVTVVGTDVFTLAISSQEKASSATDWRRASLDELRQMGKAFDLPASDARRCVDYIQSYGLEYGAFDFILSPRDELFFLELNPHGAWGFAEQITGLPISSTIANYLAAAESSVRPVS